MITCLARELGDRDESIWGVGSKVRGKKDFQNDKRKISSRLYKLILLKYIPSTKTNPKNVNANARTQTRIGRDTIPMKLNNKTDVKDRSLASMRICSNQD